MTRILWAHVASAPGHARWFHAATQSGDFNGAPPQEIKESRPCKRGMSALAGKGDFREVA
ncbi:hypothetical protein OBCHQ24_07985 [Oceanobacillus iheyensis]|nr:hypothetical protein OBCHQ24_07985 [Oceanobacillus iheyensis]